MSDFLNNYSQVNNVRRPNYEIDSGTDDFLYSLISTIPAHFSTSTYLGNMLSRDVLTESYYQTDPNFNAFREAEKIGISDLDEIEQLTDARNSKMFYHKLNKMREKQELLSALSKQPSSANFLSAMVAGTVDPVNLIATGPNLIRRAVSVVALQEAAALAAGNKTLEEAGTDAVVNMATTAIMLKGGDLFFKKFTQRGRETTDYLDMSNKVKETVRAVRETDLNPIAETLRGERASLSEIEVDDAPIIRDSNTDIPNTDIPNTETPNTELPDSPPNPDRSVGAKLTQREDTIEDLTLANQSPVLGKVLGAVGKASKFLTPSLRIAQNSSLAIRKFGQKLLQDTKLRNKNLSNVDAEGVEQGYIATETSFETMARAFKGYLANSLGGTNKAYKDYLKAYKSKRSDVGANSADALNQSAGVANRPLTKAEFMEEVGKAMRRGDVHADSYVTRAAQGMRDLYNRLLAEAEALGLLDAKKLKRYAESYLNRVYDIDKINKNVTAFKSTIRPWVRQKLIKVAERGKKRVARIEKLEKDLLDAEMELRKLKAEGKDVTAQTKKVNSLNSKVKAFNEKHGRLEPLLRALRNDDQELFEEIVEDSINDILGTIRGQNFVDKIQTSKIGTFGVLKDVKLDYSDYLIEPFLVSDISVLAVRYERLMSAEIAAQKKFGTNNIQKLLDDLSEEHKTELTELETKLRDEGKSVEEINKALENLTNDFNQGKEDLATTWDIIRGTYKSDAIPPDSAVRKALQALRTLNYVTMLGGVVVSSLVDIVTPVIAFSVRDYYKDALKPLLKTIISKENREYFRQNYQEAKDLGFATDIALNERAATLFGTNEPLSQASKFDKVFDTMARTFTSAVGLNHWNTIVKTTTYGLVVQRVARAILGETKDLERLASFGLGKDFIDELKGYKGLIQEKKLNGSTGYHLNLEALPPQVKERLRLSLYDGADSLIVAPSAGEIPIWFRGELGKTLSQFLSITLVAHQRILMSGLQSKPKDFVMAASTLFFAGLMTAYIKDAVNPRAKDRSTGEWIMRGIEFSGLATLPLYLSGKIQDFMGTEGHDYGKYSTAQGFFGPSATTLARGVSTGRALTKLVTGNSNQITDSEARDVRGLIPFNNATYLSVLLDEAKENYDANTGS